MRELSFCFGGSSRAPVWRAGRMAYETLKAQLETPIRTPESTADYQAMSREEKAVTKDKGGFLAGTLKGTRRLKTEVVSRSMITLDCDKLPADFFATFAGVPVAASAEPSAPTSDPVAASTGEGGGGGNGGGSGGSGGGVPTVYSCIAYTTHSHLPHMPRARLLFPLARDVNPDEFNAIARYLAASVGMETVDPCSFQVNQLMYWPSVSADGEYICREYGGVWLDPDRFLAQHPNWKDWAALPVSPYENKPTDRPNKKQEDPLSKSGAVGLFCRAHTVQDVMQNILPHVYEPTDDDNRWRYILSETVPGVLVYDDKFAYSHHATDPAYGQLLNAFDLVRVHLFGGDNPDGGSSKKSFSEMLAFVAQDEKSQNLALQEREERASDEFSVLEDDASSPVTPSPGSPGIPAAPASPTPPGSAADGTAGPAGPAGASGGTGAGSADGDSSSPNWKRRLVRQKRSTELENSLFNIKLIMQNDPYMKSIVFNQLADGMEIKGDVPWSHPGKFWRDADDAQLICYVDDHYGTFSARNYDIAVAKVADDRSYHPIKDYFSSLPPWDGAPRVDTLLIDYLGAEDNAYIRAVSRKTLCAAYRRVYHPGIKFDYMPVLNGAQGIGKSTLIAKLGMEWFSDSLNLSDMNDKTAAEKLQGYWIHEIGEMAGMKKADLEKVKAFVSRQDDKYRASFGRRVSSHPRQCIFFGTTNSENGYLRDITGNRRFWNVKVSGESRLKPWNLDDATVNQIWAEVRVLAEAGEPLYLDHDIEPYAHKEQREAMEQDEREGLVIAYLDTLLPDGWDQMDVYRRRDYLNVRDDPTRPQGVHRRETVSNMEIWCECFGRAKEDLKPADSYAISAIMERLDGWVKKPTRISIPLYGQQRVYVRAE